MKTLRAVVVVAFALVSSGQAFANATAAFRADQPMANGGSAVYFAGGTESMKALKQTSLEQCQAAAGAKRGSCQIAEQSAIGNCANPLYHFVAIAMHNTEQGNRAFIACAESDVTAIEYASDACKSALHSETCASSTTFSF